jgi:hypothetical protein
MWDRKHRAPEPSKTQGTVDAGLFLKNREAANVANIATTENLSRFTSLSQRAW